MRRNRFARTATTVGLAAALGIGVLGAGVAATRDARAADSARDIMDKVAQARKLQKSEAEVTMVIGDGKGNERVRSITMATTLADNGQTEKRFYSFTAPTDIKGTKILVFDYATKADMVKVFLPALRKANQIASSERKQSFMGSEFSYADLNIPSLDDYTYSVLKEETVLGEPTWVIEVKPKSDSVAKGEGYSKKVYWVGKANHVVRQGEFYDTSGKKVKRLTTKSIKKVGSSPDRYRAMEWEMTNLANNRKSVFKTVKLNTNPSTPAEVFTEASLK